MATSPTSSTATILVLLCILFCNIKLFLTQATTENFKKDFTTHNEAVTFNSKEKINNNEISSLVMEEPHSPDITEKINPVEEPDYYIGISNDVIDTYEDQLNNIASSYLNSLFDTLFGEYNPFSIMNSLSNSFSSFSDSKQDILDDEMLINPEVQVTHDEKNSECLISVDIGNLPDTSSVKVTVDRSNILEVTYSNTEERDIAFAGPLPLVSSSNSYLRGGNIKENHVQNQKNKVQKDEFKPSSLRSSSDSKKANLIDKSSSFVSTMTVTGISVKQHKLPSWCDASSLDGKATISEDSSKIFIKFPFAYKESQTATSLIAPSENFLQQPQDLESRGSNTYSESFSESSIKQKNSQTENTPTSSSYNPLRWGWVNSDSAAYKKREIPIVSFEEF